MSRWLSTFALLLATAGSMIGCAPENPGGSNNPGDTRVAGRVALPPGVPTEGLKIVSSAGSDDVDAEGDFTVDLTAPTRPNLLLVQDSAGKVVL